MIVVTCVGDICFTFLFLETVSEEGDIVRFLGALDEGGELSSCFVLFFADLVRGIFLLELHKIYIQIWSNKIEIEYNNDIPILW
jgi:hypothetical protein